MPKNEIKEIEVKSGADQYIERPTLPAIIKEDSKETFVSNYTIHIAEHLIDNESVCKSSCGSIAAHLNDEMDKYLTWEAAKCSFYNPGYVFKREHLLPILFFLFRLFWLPHVHARKFTKLCPFIDGNRGKDK